MKSITQEHIYPQYKRHVKDVLQHNSVKNEVARVDIRNDTTIVKQLDNHKELRLYSNTGRAVIIGKDNSNVEVKRENTPTILREITDPKILYNLVSNAYIRTSLLSDGNIALHLTHRLKGGMFQEKEGQINNTTEIVKKTQDYLNMAEFLYDKEAVLVLGNTGSGKSTLVNFLSGRELSVKTGGCKPTIVVKDPIVSVSDKYTSETFKPNRWHDEVNKIVYWDCPGFEDNRGPAEDIANGFFIKNLFSSVEQVKILLVLPENAILNDRGANFISLINNLSRLLPNFDKFKSAFCVVITQGQSDVNNIRIELQTIFKDKFSTLSNGQKQILEFLTSNQSKMEKFNAPVKEEDKLTKLIKEKDSLEDKIDNSKDELTTKQLTEEFNLLKSQIKDLKNSNIQYSEQYFIDPIAKERIMKIIQNEINYVSKSNHDVQVTISENSKNYIEKLVKNSHDIILKNNTNFENKLKSYIGNLSENTTNRIKTLKSFLADIQKFDVNKKSVDIDAQVYIKDLQDISTKIGFDPIEIERQLSYIDFYKEKFNFTEPTSLYTHSSISDILKFLDLQVTSVVSDILKSINNDFDVFIHSANSYLGGIKHNLDKLQNLDSIVIKSQTKLPDTVKIIDNIENNFRGLSKSDNLNIGCLNTIKEQVQHIQSIDRQSNINNDIFLLKLSDLSKNVKEAVNTEDKRIKQEKYAEEQKIVQERIARARIEEEQIRKEKARLEEERVRLENEKREISARQLNEMGDYLYNNERYSEAVTKYKEAYDKSSVSENYDVYRANRDKAQNEVDAQQLNKEGNTLFDAKQYNGAYNKFKVAYDKSSVSKSYDVYRTNRDKAQNEVDAQQLNKEGNTLFDAEQYNGAYDKFKAAYDKSSVSENYDVYRANRDKAQNEVDAKNLDSEGCSLYNQGRYQAAYNKFKAAYDKSSVSKSYMVYKKNMSDSESNCTIF